MKKIEFKTGKCEFDLLDGARTYTLGLMKNTGGLKGIYLAHITEGEASRLVDNLKAGGYENYQKEGYVSFPSAIESLHSLIKSKGVHLYENPYSNTIGIVEFDYHRNRAEQKTFYNPVIFIKSK